MAVLTDATRAHLRRRRLTNWFALAASFVATALGLAVLGAILWTLIARGFGGWSSAIFTQMTPAPGSSGGLLNAIVGSAMMAGIGIALGTPIGLLAGTYLAEYSTEKLGAVVRFINDVLLSAPSIIVGLFVYAVLVVPAGHFSGIAGAVSLGILTIPITVRTAEDMLRSVPQDIREASVALGAQPWRTIVRIVYPAARSGLITGCLLAVARVSGETAPLLFTALNNQFWSVNLNGPMANLPTVIFQFAMSPYEDWRALAWSGALIITLFVLVLSVGARMFAPSSFSRRGRP
jgi:phosphate transport system permease protein